MAEIIQTSLNRITTLHAEITEMAKNALQKAIEIGGLLLEEKDQVGHGNWGQWMDENLPFNQRTAQRYMELNRYRHLLKNDTVSDLDFRSARMLIHRQKHFDEEAAKHGLSEEKRQALLPMVKKPEIFDDGGEGYGHGDCFDIDRAVRAATPPKQIKSKPQLTEFEAMLCSLLAKFHKIIETSWDQLQDQIETVRDNSWDSWSQLDYSDRVAIDQAKEKVNHAMAELLSVLDSVVVRYWKNQENE